MTGPRLDAAYFRSAYGWPYLLTPLIPIAVALDLAGAPATVVFAAAALGIIPTAALMGRATEELAARSGPGIGGLLNVTFGNAPELIIALFALGQGLQEVVKASIVGSIIGNILLVLGAAMFAGGLGREKQTFSRTGASVQTSMLLLAAAALLMPAIFELVEGQGLPAPGAQSIDYGSTVEHLSLRRRDRPHRHLRDRPRLLAEDAPRHLQSRVRRRGQLGLVDPDLGDRAGDRRHPGRSDVRGAGRLDQATRRTRSASPSSSSA